MLQQKARLCTHPASRQGHGNRRERSAPPVLWYLESDRLGGVGLTNYHVLGRAIFGTQRWRKDGTLEHPLDHLYNIRCLPITKPPTVWKLVAVGMIVVSFSPLPSPQQQQPLPGIEKAAFQCSMLILPKHSIVDLSIWMGQTTILRDQKLVERDLLNVTRHLIGLNFRPFKLPKLTVAWLLGWLLTYAYLLLLICLRASTKQHSYRNLLYPSRPASLKAFCKLAGSVNFWGRHECPSFLTHG